MYVWFAAAMPILLAGLVSKKTTLLAMKITSGGGLAIARVVGGVRYRVHGRAPSRGIVAAKHMSMMETGIMFHEIKNPFFVLKKELMMVPIYGWAFARSGMIPVDRKKADVENMVRRASEEMEKGRVLIIFPEGTRVAPGDDAHFKGGVMRIAQAAKQPITPVGLDTGIYWPKKGPMAPGVAQVYFGKPLPWDASLEEIKKAIQERSV
jgi:1-acyl-sn-glycerol-3-phosphate acyltransferase